MQLRRIAVAIAAVAILGAGVACSDKDDAGVTPAAMDAPSATPTPGRSPAATPTRGPSPTPSPGLDDVRAELEAHVLDTIPGDARADEGSFDGILSVVALPIYSGAYGQFTSPWLVVTVGRPKFDPFYPHFAAVYQDQDGAWAKLDRLSLDDAEFIAPESVQPVDLEPSLDWATIDAGVGAHGGYFALLSWDGSRLRLEVSNFSGSPDAGYVGDDLDGDGDLEVFLDTSNYDVFCYACGVVDWHTDIYRWDGRRLERVELKLVALSSPATAEERANNRAVTFANGHRWKEAYREVRAARLLDASDETIRWNAFFIRENARQRIDGARDATYPFLQHVFAGDWDAAVDELRDVPLAQLFAADSPVIAGTVVEGWEDVLVSEVLRITSVARFAGPEVAALEFLHGWALQMETPGSDGARAALQRAADLAPGDGFYAAVAALVEGG